MKTLDEQQALVGMSNPYPTVKQWLQEGEQLYPFVWENLIESLKPDEVMELAQIANQTNVWMPKSVLIYLLENQSGFNNFLSRLFNNKTDIIGFFQEYHAKHESENWSEKFVMTAVKQPNFKKLLSRLKFPLSDEVHVEMAKRNDFVDCITQFWPFDSSRFWLCAKAQVALAQDPDFNKLLAYVKKTCRELACSAFTEYLSSANFSEKRTIELLKFMKEPSATLSEENISTLLALKNHDLSLLVISGMSGKIILDDQSQKMLLETSNPQDLIYKYVVYRSGEVFSPENLMTSVSLMANDECLSDYVSTLLSKCKIGQDFVDWLAGQPDDFIKNLMWQTEQLRDRREEFWLMTLDTKKAALFMQMYKLATIDWRNNYRKPEEGVLIKMLQLPNAAELVAIWDRQAGEHSYVEYGRTCYWYDTNQYYFPETVLAEMVKSPSYEAIRSVISKHLRNRLDDYVSKNKQ